MELPNNFGDYHDSLIIWEQYPILFRIMTKPTKFRNYGYFKFRNEERALIIEHMDLLNLVEQLLDPDDYSLYCHTDQVISYYQEMVKLVSENIVFLRSIIRDQVIEVRMKKESFVNSDRANQVPGEIVDLILAFSNLLDPFHLDHRPS